MDSAAPHLFTGANGHDVLHRLESDVDRTDYILRSAYSAGGLGSGNAGADKHGALVDEPLQLIGNSKIDGETANAPPCALRFWAAASHISQALHR